MTPPGCNAVELGCGMEQADRRWRVVGNVLLFSPFHGEGRMMGAFHCAGAGALPAGRDSPLSGLPKCLPDRLSRVAEGEKPPARQTRRREHRAPPQDGVRESADWICPALR